MTELLKFGLSTPLSEVSEDEADRCRGSGMTTSVNTHETCSLDDDDVYTEYIQQ